MGRDIFDQHDFYRAVMACALFALAAQASAPVSAQAVTTRPAPDAELAQPAEEAAASETNDTSANQPENADARQTYAADFFAQFAPRNALDMLREVPGFEVREDNSQRGLGQATANVLVNERRLSGKSESATDQVARIPAGNVVRIEIIEGTMLDIPGLTGQVANIVVAGGALSGQFAWRPQYRIRQDDISLGEGEVSVRGTLGALTYTLAFENDLSRFGRRGPTFLFDGNDTLLGRQDIDFTFRNDRPSLSANLTYDFGDSVLANLNASYTDVRFRFDEVELTSGSGLTNKLRNRLTREPGLEYEISGDIEFPIGASRLKLIGLERFDEEDRREELVNIFADGSPDDGNGFALFSQSGERVGRAEWNFGWLGGDWQISGEAAFNRLDNTARLLDFQPSGDFLEIDFPEASGAVRETRYEGIVSYGRAITPNLSIQTNAGVEYSRIEQSGLAANSRAFIRPKGAVSLAWQVQTGFDLSFEVERVVGQLSFGDFLARVFLDDGNANAGNNELVPEQRWDLSIEANKTLGKWGSTTLLLEHRRISDLIDIVPLPGGVESRGNIASASLSLLDWNSTFNLEPVGIIGGQADLRIVLVDTRFTDPLDGATRAFSDEDFRVIDFDYRHDIPNTEWAYGFGIFHEREEPSLRLGQIEQDDDGPVFADVFLEHKDVFGLTVNARLTNVLDGKNRRVRTVFDGLRSTDPILFVERREQPNGQSIRVSVTGSF